MLYYNVEEEIPEEDILQNHIQCKLTKSTSYKLLEIGTLGEDGNQYFVVRLTKNAYDHTYYVDLNIDEFNAIIDLATKIFCLMNNNQCGTVYNTDYTYAHVVMRPQPLLCIGEHERSEIYMMKRTFQRLLNRSQWVMNEYNNFMGLDTSYGDSDNLEYSYDDSDDSEYFYNDSDDLEYSYDDSDDSDGW